MLYWENRRKFRSQTSDNMDRWKAEQGRGREKRKIRRKKSKKKEDADAWKGRKVAMWGSGGSKSRLAKAAGAEPAGQMRDEKCTPLWREAHFQVKMYKAHQVRTTFGSWDVEKVHAVVAWSTFRSQNVQNTPAPDHFCHFRCRKCARQAHFEVKMYKTHQLRTTFGSWAVEKVHAVVARSTFPSQNVKNTGGSDHFWRFRCRKSARCCGAKHISKSKW